MCGGVVGWLAGFGLLNCSHSVYEDRSSYWFCSSFRSLFFESTNLYLSVELAWEK